MIDLLFPVTMTMPGRNPVLPKEKPRLAKRYSLANIPGNFTNSTNVTSEGTVAIKKKLHRTDGSYIIGRAEQDSHTSSHSKPPIWIEDHTMSYEERRMKASVSQEKRLQSLEKLDAQKKRQSHYSSCPNVLDDVPFTKAKVKLHTSKSDTISMLKKMVDSSDLDPDHSNKSLLRVPDMFMTSQTRSSSAPGVRNADIQSLDQMSTSRMYRYSAPELTLLKANIAKKPRSALGIAMPNTYPAKKPLVKSLSDNPPMTKRTDAPRRDAFLTQSLQSLRLQDDYEPRIVKIADLLYLGNLAGANHEKMMCRLGINSIVDLSNCAPEEFPKNQVHSMPCLCGNNMAHQRTALRLGLSINDRSELEDDIKKINRFIEGSKANNKRILVFCCHGDGPAAFAVIQYLMTHRDKNLRKAYSTVMMQTPSLKLEEAFKVILQKREKELFPVSRQSNLFDSSTESTIPREAWGCGVSSDA